MAAITELSVITDKDEYSRFESENQIVTVIIFPKPTDDINETLTVELIKGRRTRDRVVYTQDITVDSSAVANSNSFEHQIDLDTIRDVEDVSYLRRGRYFVRVKNAAATVTADTSDFDISVVTADRLRKDYLFGVNLEANDIRFVMEQPRLITGVQVVSVSRNHPEDFFWLRLNTTTTHKELTWRGGPSVAITRTGTYFLKSGDGKGWIQVRVTDINALNDESVQEELLISKETMPEETLRRHICQATDWIENVGLQTYIEPTQLVTEVSDREFNFGGTNPQNITNNLDYDYVKQPVTWYPTTEGHWISIKLPILWGIRVNNLFGKTSDTRILDVQSGWVEMDFAQSYIELVPFNKQFGFTFEGLAWTTALLGQGSLPNFWRYNITAGLRDPGCDVQEIVGKKAAVDVLVEAGQAFRGGIASQAISRDGVSESVSFTSSAMYGVYSASIEEYKRYIKDELPRLRGKYTGAKLMIV